MSVVLIRRAEVYAPEALGVCDVLVAGGVVAAIGPHLSPPPSDWPVEVVDASGLRLVPGLIDVHAHITGGGGEGGAHTRVTPVAAASFLDAGVTTVIGLLGTDCTTRSIAENLACARGLEHYGLHALCYTGGYQVPPVTLTGTVRGDIVHVDRIVAVGEVAISDHRSSHR
jgi:beta-aspartyl-dipeptidase (metallo-type)